LHDSEGGVRCGVACLRAFSPAATWCRSCASGTASGSRRQCPERWRPHSFFRRGHRAWIMRSDASPQGRWSRCSSLPGRNSGHHGSGVARSIRSEGVVGSASLRLPCAAARSIGTGLPRPARRDEIPPDEPHHDCKLKRPYGVPAHKVVASIGVPAYGDLKAVEVVHAQD
jgi:hypothetical protein